MSTVEVQGVFDVEEEQAAYTYESSEDKSQVQENTFESPSEFLNNLNSNQTSSATTSSFESKPAEFPAQSGPFSSASASASTTSNSKPSEFMPAISPSMMLSSMANSSPAAESILSSARERINQIRPWKDFFSLDQFRVPESTTAAQSRASHNFAHFQNNYLVVFALFCGFSLISNLSLLMVAAVILGGFYYISTLASDFTIKIGNQEVNSKQISYGWITISVILLYMSSALSTVFWIVSITAVITIAHAAFHDISIENEFNSV